MTLPAFTPRQALAWAFRPRLWMGLAPQDGPGPSGPSWWAAYLFNEGPALFGVQVSLAFADGGTLRHRIDILAEGNAGFLFLGGPASAPPEAEVEIRARNGDGRPLDATFRCLGARRPAALPPAVAARPVLPLVPGLAWPCADYLPVLRDLPALPPGGGNPLQRAWLEAAWRWLRETPAPPTRALAREVAWAATAAVFGAGPGDRRDEEVAALLDSLASRLQNDAAEHAAASRPARGLPRRRLALALVPGPGAELHVLNPGRRPARIQLLADRFRWGRHTAALAPVRTGVLRVPARAGVLAGILRPWDAEQELDCRLLVFGDEAAPAVLHALFPAGATARREDAIPIPLLGGRRAHVRRLEALLEPPGLTAA